MRLRLLVLATASAPKCGQTIRSSVRDWSMHEEILNQTNTKSGGMFRLTGIVMSSEESDQTKYKNVDFMGTDGWFELD
jgi:hypothetical protein